MDADHWLAVVGATQRELNLRAQCDPGGIPKGRTAPKFAQLDLMGTQK